MRRHGNLWPQIIAPENIAEAFRKSALNHALMNVVSPIWERLFIRDSYACIVGRGIHAGSRKTMEYVRRNKYVLKCDVAKFYPSIDHDILMGIVRRKIKCRDTLWLIEHRLALLPGLFAKGRITKEQFRSSVASTQGWLKHANSKNFSGAVE